jgi:hypothetical protein
MSDTRMADRHELNYATPIQTASVNVKPKARRVAFVGFVLCTALATALWTGAVIAGSHGGWHGFVPLSILPAFFIWRACAAWRHFSR